MRASRGIRTAVAGTAVLALATLEGPSFLVTSIGARNRDSLSPLSSTASATTTLAASSQAPSAYTLASVASLCGLTAAIRRSQTSRRANDPNAPDFDDPPFEIRGFSLAQVVFGAGILLTVISFSDYFFFATLGGSGLGGLTFIYAVPLLVIGGALGYTEIPPAEVVVEPDATGLFDKLATKTLRKIKKDVTRHRYGDNAHLDSSLKALGFAMPAARYPQLQTIIESKSPEGELEFSLLFESKDVPFTAWADPLKIVACDRFFGPGLWAEISKFDSEKRIAKLKLTTGARPSRAPLPTSIPALQS